MSSCTRHPSKESVGVCVNCGKLVCTACYNEVGGKSYCPVCVDKLFTAAKPEQPAAPVAAVKKTPAAVKEVAPGTTAMAGSPAPAVKQAPSTPVSPKIPGTGINKLWWLAVALGGWIGGLIAWLLNKEKYPAASKYMLYGGIGWSALQAVVVMIIVVSTVIAPAAGTWLTKIKPSTPKAGITAAPSTGNTQSTAGNTSANQVAVKTAPKEETIEVNPPAKNQYPPPTYQTNTLATQILQPSDTDQTIKYEDKVSVTVPGGDLKQQDTVTISSVSGAPAWNFPQRNDIGMYDISFAGGRTFEKPISLEFTYDPVETGASAGQEYGASYLDVDGKTWVDMPASVDESRHKVIVSTPHASIWRYWWYGGTSKSFVYGKFDVHYWDSDFQASAWSQADDNEMADLKKKRLADNITPVEKVRLNELIKRFNALAQSSQGTQVKNALADFNGCLDPATIYTTYSKYPKYVVDTGVFLERARKTYADKFGKELSPDVLISEKVTTNTDMSAAPFATPVGQQTEQQFEKGQNLLVVIDPGEQASAHNGWIGHIMVHSNANCGLTGLGVTLAHELFHAVQSMDHYALVRQPGSVFGFVIPDSLWWYESTADYAAFKIVKEFDQPTNHSLTPEFFKEDFFSSGNPDENHPYKVAWFFDYLAKQGVSFTQLFNAVDANYRTRLYLDEYLKENSTSKLGLYESFREWYTYVLFDEHSPVKRGLDANARQPDTTMQNLIINLGEGMTAGYQGIYPIVGPTGKRTLIVTLQQMSPEVHPEYGWVNVYKLNQNERKMSSLELAGTWDVQKDSFPQEICQVDLKDGDALYILVAKYGAGLNSFFINVSDQPSIKLICPDLPDGGKGTMGQAYDFERKSEGIPSSATYTWYVDGKSLDKSGGTLTHRFWDGGEHTVQAKASWSTLRSAESNTCIIGIGNPLIDIKSPLGAGEKGISGLSYTFTQESKYVPTGAEYWWYVNDKEINGNSGGASPTFDAPGTYAVKVRAEWPVPDGGTHSIEDSATVTIQSGFQLSASPVPGNAGESTRFVLSGQGIPANAGFTWDFGKQEGGVSTNTKDVSHTYNSADTFPVSVTVVDRGTGKTLGKATLNYQVVTQPYVVISPRPGTAKPGDKITFSFKLFNMPPDMASVPRSSWIFSYNGTQEAWPTDEQATFIFDRQGKYNVDVIIRATDKNNRSIKGKEGDSWLKDSVSITVEGVPTVTIIPPTELAKGVGIPEKSYVFSAKPQDIPTNAEYTWYVNDKSLGKSSKDKSPSVKTEKEPKDYTVSVVARWKVNNQPKEAEGSFDFTTNNAVVLSNGVFVSGVANGKTDEKFGLIFFSQVFAKTVINVVNGKATANQSVPFTITANEGATLNGSAKIKVDGTDNKGVLTGTFNIDAVINYVDEGKTTPIDIKYSGKFKSAAIPANPANATVALTFTGYIQSHALMDIIEAAGAACASSMEEWGGGSSSTTTTFTRPENDILCPAYISNVNFTASVAGK